MKLTNPGVAPSSIVFADFAAPLLQASKIQLFTASGTYTPTAGMRYVRVRAWGGGGAGGGNSGFASSGAPGGNGGASAERYLTSAQIGASQVVTIGSGGTGVSGGAGNAGGATTLGALVSAAGGEGGPVGNTGGAPGISNPAASSQSATGDVRGFTIQSVAGIAPVANLGYGSKGGETVFGGAGESGGFDINGLAANGFGSGGGGSANNATSTLRSGGAGFAGIMIIEEFF
jgi:hypothetical protein